MADERHTFAQARTRLEEIVVQVRKKDCSLEKSLDLLEEGVRLANTCTELSDHAEWPTVVAEEHGADAVDAPDSEERSHEADGATDTGEQASEPTETPDYSSEEPRDGE